MDSILCAATVQLAPLTVQWTENMYKAFQDLNTAHTTTQSLGLPDYHWPFNLHVLERDGFFVGILIQKHVSHYLPVVPGLWCARLSEVSGYSCHYE